MTKLVDIGAIGCHFESLSDPRHTRNRKHLLGDIIVIAVCSIVCGCDGPTAIHRWASHRADWLKEHLPLVNGIPSRDCIRRLLIVLKPEAFQQCFRTWIASAIIPADPNAKQIVAIDGKTCRGSHDAGKNLSALHIVSALQCAVHTLRADTARQVVHHHLGRKTARVLEAAGAHGADGRQQKTVHKLCGVALCVHLFTDAQACEFTTQQRGHRLAVEAQRRRHDAACGRAQQKVLRCQIAIGTPAPAQLAVAEIQTWPGRALQRRAVK